MTRIGFQLPDELGIGVDIESVSRFHRAKTKDDKFLRTFMTSREIEYCFSKESPFPHIAARFAGKEAIIKALSGLSIRNISFKDIEIMNDTFGMPSASISSKRKLDITVMLSLSHSVETAIAFALVVKEGRDG